MSDCVESFERGKIRESTYDAPILQTISIPTNLFPLPRLWRLVFMSKLSHAQSFSAHFSTPRSVWAGSSRLLILGFCLPFLCLEFCEVALSKGVELIGRDAHTQHALRVHHPSLQDSWIHRLVRKLLICDEPPRPYDGWTSTLQLQIINSVD